MVLETHMKLCVPPKLGKWSKNVPKTGYFEFIEKYVIIFYWICYNENLYYLLCSSTNSIFRKVFVPEIWATVFSAKQIAEFFNQPYLQNKWMEWPDFWHVATNLHKLRVDQKFFGWAWSNMGVANLVSEHWLYLKNE